MWQGRYTYLSIASLSHDLKHSHPVADTRWTTCKICHPLQIFGNCTRYWAFRW